MKLTFYGHSSFGLEINGKHILFDPFISPNEKASHIKVDEIPADYILISHGHEDHVADVENIAKRTGATIVSNFEIVSYFQGKGIENGHPMNFGGHWNFGFGRVQYVPALHSSVLPDGSYAGNPGGFIIETEEGTVYYAGDTALSMEMKLFARKKIDTALLPIGDNFTMGIEDAVSAAEFIDCDNIIGMHFDTFGYIEIDHSKAKSAFESAGKKLTLMNIGETLNI